MSRSSEELLMTVSESFGLSSTSGEEAKLRKKQLNLQRLSGTTGSTLEGEEEGMGLIPRLGKEEFGFGSSESPEAGFLSTSS